MSTKHLTLNDFKYSINCLQNNIIHFQDYANEILNLVSQYYKCLDTMNFNCELDFDAIQNSICYKLDDVLSDVDSIKDDLEYESNQGGCINICTPKAEFFLEILNTVYTKVEDIECYLYSSTYLDIDDIIILLKKCNNTSYMQYRFCTEYGMSFIKTLLQMDAEGLKQSQIAQSLNIPIHEVKKIRKAYKS